jgi:hypothetical protein
MSPVKTRQSALTGDEPRDGAADFELEQDAVMAGAGAP